MTIIDTHPIFKERQDFIREIEQKTSKGVYGEELAKSEEYASDCSKLAQIEEACKARTMSNLKQSKVIVKQIANSKDINILDIQKRINLRYEELRMQYKEIEDLLAYNREKRQQGRDFIKMFKNLKEKDKEGKKFNKDDIIIINEMMQF